MPATIWCEGEHLNVGSFTERECAAAHALHRVHDTWARDSVGRAEECYQCHVFARNVERTLDAFDREHKPSIYGGPVTVKVEDAR